jgi:hypothetical protein
MNITGYITGINYKVNLVDSLKKIKFSEFDINKVPTACIIEDNNYSFAISRWVSPKRTRSYPYERVYNTLTLPKKITVIPIIKDEGADGDRDYIQWDTISLMSLLDVFIIFAYYYKADTLKNKITKQKFDNSYILEKIKEIEQYHSSALHWNLNELNTNFHKLIEKVITSYSEIEMNTGIKLHGFKGLENFQDKIGKDVSLFMNFSRGKAEQAQSREFVTIQPKEYLSTSSKGKITIINYLGGKYFLTVDEIKVSGKNLFLIESKHSKNSILPSKGDIKDGLLKMILFSNLTNTKVDEKNINCQPILELTSIKLKDSINSNSSINDIEHFILQNNFNDKQKLFLMRLLDEAKLNKFTINIKQVK